MSNLFIVEINHNRRHEAAEDLSCSDSHDCLSSHHHHHRHTRFYNQTCQARSRIRSSRTLPCDHCLHDCSERNTLLRTQLYTAPDTQHLRHDLDADSEDDDDDTCHDGGELTDQVITPVTQLIDVNILTVSCNSSCGGSSC